MSDAQANEAEKNVSPTLLLWCPLPLLKLPRGSGVEVARTSAQAAQQNNSN